MPQLAEKAKANETREILIAAKKVISTPDKWCRGNEAVNEKGVRVLALSATAVAFCSIGAIRKAIGFSSVHDRHVVQCRTESALESQLPCGFDELLDYNDLYGSHEDIMSLFDRAIAVQSC